MHFKTDTKQKFIVLYTECNHLSANLAAALCTKLREIGAQPPHNVILNLNGVQKLDRAPAEELAALRTEFYENQRSFVVCCLQPAVMDAVVSWELEEALNLTPTESEAWDIVQMDEIEREFLAGEE
jgi:anti-anti-sigma regulatory factor